MTGPILMALALACSSKDSEHHPDDSATPDDSTPVDDSGSGDGDEDGDGSFVPADCDDTDPDVHPGAVENVGDGTDSDCDGGELCYADWDGDGYSDGSVINSPDADCTDVGEVDSGAPQTDCDDTDPDINPRGTEVCDAGDNDEDCDGVAEDLDPDVDAATLLSWYADTDGDGYGDAASLAPACDAPAGTVADATDCDDTDSAQNPAAAEGIGDEVDSDCNGSELCYADADGDGYSDGALTTSADLDCSDATETLALGDCDDASASLNPDATEICDSFDTDEDCDGLADDADPDVDLGWSPLYYADADADGYGDLDDAGTRFCDDPSGASYTFDHTDCDDGSDTVHPGATEVCPDGVDDDCDGDTARCSLSAADATLEGVTAGDYAGWEVAAAGDVDGDGNDDLLVGAPSKDDSRGSAYLVRGPVTGTVDLSTSTAEFVGTDSYDEVGLVLAPAGDMDGDGNDDVLLGAIGIDEQVGAVYLFGGPLSGTLDATSADAVLTGEAAYDQAGSSVAAAGDVDGDGQDDLLVGAGGESSAGEYAGASYVVLGPVSGAIDLDTAQAKLTGEDSYDSAATVAGPGDVDGDGWADVLVGAWGEATAGLYAGAVYVVSGPVTGVVDLATADAKLTGESAYDNAGTSLAGVGDVDADGNDDFLVGASGNDAGTADAGAVYLVLGPVSGSTDLPSVADATFLGADATDAAGSVADAGDVNGDGSADFLVGVPNDGAASTGAAYLVLGPVSGTFDLALADAKLEGTEFYAYVGPALAGVGDENGDGFDDVLVGAGNEGDAGRAYLVLGSSW